MQTNKNNVVISKKNNTIELFVEELNLNKKTLIKSVAKNHVIQKVLQEKESNTKRYCERSSNTKSIIRKQAIKKLRKSSNIKSITRKRKQYKKVLRKIE